MALVNIKTAAELVSRDRKTLYGAIKTGKLSAVLDNATGEKRIDTSELERVYGPLRQATQDKQDSHETVSTPQLKTTDETLMEVALLKAEIAQLRERMADKDRHIDDLRSSIRLIENKVQKADKRPWLLRMFR